MKEVKVFEGWVGKDVKLPSMLCWDGNTLAILETIYETKGKSENWFAEEYPPKPVKITVELG